MLYSAENLRFRTHIPPDRTGLVNRVSPETAGWSELGMEVHRLAPGETWRTETDGNEAALVLLGGRLAVQTDRGEWPSFGRRPDVWGGMPWAIALPPGTRVAVRALGLASFAWAWAPSEEGALKVVTPDEVSIELRGGGQNSRQINGILPPGCGCRRLVCVEVYTPAGNWSSYPPHKHDEHRVGPDGALLEADLEEIYYYEMRRPGGHAVQRVYTADGGLDAAIVARHGDVVIVPYGYHPVAAPFGYDCYYLNFLAGSAQSLACTDDPQHAWVKSTWDQPDPRLPVVSHAMETA